MSLSLLAVYALAVALFLVLLITLGFQPRVITRFTGVLLLITGILGTLFYGYGFYINYGSIPQSVARTLFAVFCMFLGRNEIGAISSAPLFQSPVMLICLYLTHLLALYCTASAVVAAIGTRLIRTLNLLLLRRGNLSMIYGVNADTVSFAQKLPKKTKVIFVDSGSGAAFDSKILHMGSLMMSDDDAKNATAEFLRHIGFRPGKRCLSVYCLDEDPAANLRYARSLLDSLEQAGIQPQQTRLSLILPDESVSADFQAANGHYGYGSVLAYEREALLARLMIHAFPPCDTMRFDGRGRADENFEALIVGFGKTGQAALRALVMNGQFTGSRFHATIVAKGYAQQAGSFFSRYPAIRDQFDLTFIDADARSIELYEQIQKTGPALNYVAICTGNEKEAGEIAVEFSRLFETLGIGALILQCGTSMIRKNADSRGPASTVSVLIPEILSSDDMDAAAMQINYAYYRSQGGTAREHWDSCDYFSRMSCRASADFLDAFLRSAGTNREEASKEGFSLDPEVLENLAQTEHLRWNAFHYAMGYRPMPEQVWQDRAEQYRSQKAAGEAPLRIGKDSEKRLHACLIDWDDLDALSARENEITGGRTDYRQSDRDNVEMLLTLLRQDPEGGN